MTQPSDLQHVMGEGALAESQVLALVDHIVSPLAERIKMGRWPEDPIPRSAPATLRTLVRRHRPRN
jgi:hypothetical protein